MNRQTLAYIAPFFAFVALMMLGNWLGLAPGLAYPLRTAGAAITWFVLSRRLVSLRPARPLASAALGVAVFAIWIGPELLQPGYRSHWLFQNVLTGALPSGPPVNLRNDAGFLAVRVFGSTVVVPVVEELFWRGWLMRWLVKKHVWEVPLGTYAWRAFWLSAVLFAAEHGPYWDVGLAAGVAYNWWMVRTKSLADCMLAHAVTNGCLAYFVLQTRAWWYWV